MKGMRYLGLVLAAVTAGGTAAQVEGRFELHPAGSQPAAGPAVPFGLALDDGGPEGTFGVVESRAARQFLWLNRFDPPGAGGPFQIEEVQVLFPGGAGVEVGAPVEIVLYRDPDGDPANGAGYLASAHGQVQAVDGATFSTYPLSPPVIFDSAVPVLIGVVNRYTVSGASPPSSPAALDTTFPVGRSWLAVWSGDPPSPPILPADGFLVPIDDFQPPAAGNWMIRGFGRSLSIAEVPALDPVGLVLLVALLALAGGLALRRAQQPPPATGGGAPWAAGLLLLSLAMPATAAAPFRDRTPIGGASGANRFTLVDLDRDGDRDVVLAAFDSIRWFENDGAAGFTAHTLSTDVLRGQEAAAGDLDGDGDLDVVSAAFGPPFGSPPEEERRLVWYENDGEEGFTARTVQTGVAFTAVSIADLDGDGDLDLVTASRGFPDGVRWFENDGAGSFTFRSLGGPDVRTINDVETVDLDRDGDVDVVATDSANQLVLWFENDGAAGFTRRVVVSAVWPETVEAADVDRDGDPDLVIATRGTTAFAWLENDGAQGFTTRSLLQGERLFRSASPADLDGDGDVDVLATTFTGGEVGWFENDGRQGFTFHLLAADAAGAIAAAAGDLDGDGDLDLVASLFVAARIDRFENRTIHRSAVFDARPPLTIRAAGTGPAAAGDLDGDGDPDVVFAVSEAQTRDLVWAENTAGDGSAWTERVLHAAAGVSGLRTADLDGDGDLDVLAGLSGSAVWYENLAGDAGAWLPRTVGTGGGFAREVDAADVDGDGDLDVLLGWERSDEIAWYENTSGDGGTWTEHVLSTAFDGPQSVFAADVDRDGDLDAVSASFGSSTVAWHENLDGAGGAWTTHVVDAAANVVVIAHPADVDGDGDLDLTAALLAEDRVAWYENLDGAGGTWAEHTVASGFRSAADSLPIDLDGDGDLDVVGTAVGDGELSWFENLAGGGGGWSQHPIPLEAGTPRRVTGADLDGDGDPDLLASVSPGRIDRFENRGGQFGVVGPDAPPLRVASGVTSALPPVTVHHRGRAGDGDLELTSLKLHFDDGRLPLSSEELAALVARLSVHLDDGSGTFEENSDAELASLEAPTLVDGLLSLALPAGDPDLLVSHGATRTYFVVAAWAADAFRQEPDRLRIRHRVETPSTAEDAEHGLPLTLELSPEAAVTVEVNDPPAPAADVFDLPEDNTLVVGLPGVLDNDRDEEGDPLSAVLETPPARAAGFSLGADGSFRYTPAEHWSGSDGFTYRVSDGLEVSAPVAVSLVVLPVADPPRLAVTPATGTAGTPIPLGIDAALVDPDGSENLFLGIAGVPAGAALSAGQDLGGGRWQLRPDELRGLTLTVSPGPGGSFDLGVTATAEERSSGDLATVSATLPVTVGTDLRVSITESADPVVAGSGAGNLTYGVTVTNAGGADATGLALSVRLETPAGVTVESITASTGGLRGESWAVGSLPAGESATVTAVLTVGPSVPSGPDAVSLAAAVTAVGQVDTAPGDESDFEATSVLPGADLSVDLDDGAESAVPGTRITYRLVVTNAGLGDAPQATVELLPPAALSALEWRCTASPGSSCTPGPVTGDLADAVAVPAGGVLTYEISADVAAGALGELASVARVSPAPGAGDSEPGNDTDDDVDLLTPETDLRITKRADADPWLPGTPLVYTLSVVNGGPSDALGVVVTDELPAALAPVATSGCAEDPAGAPVCTLGTIPAGATASYTLEAAVAPAPPAEVTNRASVTGTHPEVDPDDNRGEETTHLDAEAPRVVAIEAVDGSPIGECSTMRESVRALRVRFSEPMVHAPGVSGSVTEAASYRLVTAAPGAGFDTERCAGGSGGDAAAAVETVTYDEAERSATLHLEGGAALPDGLHRLLVCGTVADLAGNRLGGRSRAGGDHATTFRIDRLNLLSGGHFDAFGPACTLDDWQSSGSGPAELSPEDAGGSPLSGSAHGPGPLTGLDLGQCVSVPAGRPLALRAAVRITSAAEAVVGVALEAAFFSGTACDGSQLDRRVFATGVVGPSEGWMPISHEVTPPPGTTSARYRVVLEAPFGDPFDGHLDAAFLGTQEVVP